MLTTIVTRIVAASCRHALAVVLAATLVSVASAYYAVTHFAINTDSSKLISTELPWRKREAAFNAAFPHGNGLILMVIDGATPEVAQAAASALVAKLGPDHDHFESVKLPDEEAFFGKNGLLFQPTDKVEQTVEQLSNAQPMVSTLAYDPSLRGFMTVLSLISAGVDKGRTGLDDVAPLLGKVADTAEGARDGRFVPFSFQQLVAGQGTAGGSAPAGGPAPGSAPAPGSRRFVQIKPKLDYTNLEPGEAATGAVDAAVHDLALTPDRGVRVRLTGQVPLDDQEFATLKDGWVLNAVVTVLAVLFILWLALKSGRLIFAVFLSTFVGLVATLAVGLAAVTALNLISIAFAVLFVGIGVDFGIQFSVRYRDERFSQSNLVTAITAAGGRAGRGLSLAAAATAAGFYSFLPTTFRGVSELGIIAGNGMIIAFLISITLLPALLTLLHPPSEGREVGFGFLAPLDEFLSTHRWWVIALTFGIAILGSPLLLRVTFDFNPLNLNSTKVQSVATLIDLMKDPDTTPNKIDVLEPTLDAARAKAAALAKIPEVGSAKTIEAFVPADQDAKLPLVQDLRDLIGSSLNPTTNRPAPTDAEDATALRNDADRFDKVADKGTGASAGTAHRLAGVLRQLADGPPQGRQAARDAFMPPARILVDQLRTLITAEPVTLANLPPELVRAWQTPDGASRVEVTPRDLDNSNATLKRFSEAVLRVVPEATGQPVVIQESGRSVIEAFVEAGLLALAAISVLLFAVLRRLSDVLLTLVPLLMAGMLTLEISVLIGLQLNFANIIALPLLLGLGVAFKIYFVMAWRAGQVHLLQSSLTRAVFFSAMTTAVAFGSLWSSNHPGTSSMGKLLTLSLFCTLVAAVFFQPALMGPPRKQPRTADDDGALAPSAPELVAEPAQ